MIDAIATCVDSLPCDTAGPVYPRGDRQEYRFYLAEQRLRLPVLFCGQHQFMTWAGFIHRESVEAGHHAGKEPCRIEASFCLAGGIWYQVVDGITALCRESRVWMMVQESSHYYQVMTRQRTMPVATPYADLPAGW